MRRYILVNRDLVSRANCADPAADSAWSTASLLPTFRIVSIIPGIDRFAPERTLTSSGRGPRPNVREVSASSHRIRRNTSSQTASRVAAGLSRYRAPTSVVMQNAGGTGNLCRRMTSMPWPLLPKSSRGWSASPFSNTTVWSVEVAASCCGVPLPRAIRAVVHPLLIRLVSANAGMPLCSHTALGAPRLTVAANPAAR